MSGCTDGNNLPSSSVNQSDLYECSICKLHFETKNLADRCEEWCKNNNSCNMEIAGQSIEARKRKSD